MKSLMKIYVKYILTAVGLIFAFVVFQLVLLGVITAKLYGGERGENYSVRQIYDSLDNREQTAAYLEEMGAAFAVLLDDGGDPVWSYRLPENLNHHYTTSQVASFTRWYLDDYPVSVWGGERGLLVLGHPRGSVWNYSIHQNMEDFQGLMTFLALSACCTAAAAALILLVSGYRYYRRMRVLADAIGQLADGGSVHLSEAGTMKDIACTLNRTSDRLTRQREQLERRDEARTEWISGVSHDIRTPLSLVMGYADMIERQSGQNPEIQKRAALIGRQSERIRKLIEDLNLTSKLEYGVQPLRQSPVSPAAVLRRVAAELLNTLEQPERYPLSIQIAPAFEAAVLDADEQLLFRAFQNILGNSVRHNEEGCEIKVMAWAEEEKLVIRFGDGGRGIPPDICRYLNTGELPGGDVHLMGLRIVRKIAEAHGGGVRAQEEGHWVQMELPKTP